MDETHEQVVRLLKRKLAEVEALPVLPDMGAGEYAAKLAELQRKELEAVYLTFVLLPPDVLQLVNDVMLAVRGKVDL